MYIYVLNYWEEENEFTISNLNIKFEYCGCLFTSIPNLSWFISEGFQPCTPNKMRSMIGYEIGR